MHPGIPPATLLALLLSLGACGSDAPDAPPPDRGTSEATPPAISRETEKAPFLSPRGGPPGTDVRLTMDGLPLGGTVAIGFGTLVGNEILQHVEPARDGALDHTVAVPAGAEPGIHYFFIADANERPIAVSNVFVVTAPDRSLQARGTVTDEGVECTAMRGEEGELYTLTGATGGIEPGENVVVEGALAEASICQQGLTIEVRSLTRAP